MSHQQPYSMCWRRIQERGGMKLLLMVSLKQNRSLFKSVEREARLKAWRA